MKGSTMPDQVIWQLDCHRFRSAEAAPEEVLAFVRAHDLDPNEVPGDVQLIVRQQDDGLWLHARTRAVDADGKHMPCPYCSACVQTEPVVVPLRVVPPDVPEAFVARPILAEEVSGGQ
jgi:hypothetical protein